MKLGFVVILVLGMSLVILPSVRCSAQEQNELPSAFIASDETDGKVYDKGNVVEVLESKTKELLRKRDKDLGQVYQVRTAEDVQAMLKDIEARINRDYAQPEGLLGKTPKNSSCNGDAAFWFTASNPYTKPYICEWTVTIVGKAKDGKKLVVPVHEKIVLAAKGEKDSVKRIERVISEPFAWSSSPIKMAIYKKFYIADGIDKREVSVVVNDTPDAAALKGKITASADNADDVELKDAQPTEIISEKDPRAKELLEKEAKDMLNKK